MTLRKRYGARLRDVFEARRLMLDCTTDSDGDPWYELSALGDTEKPPAAAGIQWRPARPRNSRTIARVMNDSPGVRDLAAWLSRATDLELEDRTTPQSREVQLAELRAALEKSGHFGQWVAKVVDRLSKGKSKSG